MRRLALCTSQIACALLIVACNGKSERLPAPALSTSEPAHEPPKNDGTATPPEQPESSPQPAAADTFVRPPIDFTSPESAMAVLAYAIQTKEVSLLLDCFADGAWQSVNTVEKPWQRTKLTRASLADGLKAGGDYRGFLFGDDGEDSFRNYFTGANQGPWRSVRKQRFEPPESSAEQPTYVQWHKQGSHYVVSEIAFPAD